MNKVFLIGNLTRDPELTTTPNGVSVCRFSIAVQRQFQNDNGERQADFFNITTWRGLAETASKFLKKGNKVCVTGSIQIRTYDDNQGVQKTAVDIIAQELEFLTPKSAQGGEEQASRENPSTSKKKPVLQAYEDDSDIPF